MQISQKDAQVSGTLDAVDKAGRDKEVAYQKVLKGLELRRDIEKYLHSDTARSGSDPRKAGTLSSWITNVDDASGTSAATGDGSDVPDMAGTDRAMTLAQIDNAMQAAYTDGGQPNMLVVSPSKKAAFSDLNSGSVATNQINYTAPREAAIVGSVSLYLSDFGQLDVVIDRFASDDRVYLLDSDYASVCTLPNVTSPSKRWRKRVTLRSSKSLLNGHSKFQLQKLTQPFTTCRKLLGGSFGYPH